MRDLVRRLGDWRRSVRELAAQELPTLGPDAVGPVAIEIAHARRARGRMWFLMLAAVLLSAVARFVRDLVPWLGALEYVWSPMLWYCVLTDIRRSRAIASTVAAVTTDRSGGRLGLVMSALPVLGDNGRDARSVLDLAAQMLHDLPPSAFADTVSNHRDGLHAALRRTHDMALATKIIDMLGAAGGKPDVSLLSHIRSNPQCDSSCAADEGRLIEGTERALESIWARIGADESDRRLLRPAAPPDGFVATLLRPVPAGEHRDDDTLVRPTSVPVPGANSDRATEFRDRDTADSPQHVDGV